MSLPPRTTAPMPATMQKATQAGAQTAAQPASSPPQSACAASQPTGHTPLLQATGLSVMAGSGKNSRMLLNQVDCALHAGELLGIVGPNGAGKSTLLRTLLGFIAPCAGHITLQQQPFAHYSAQERARRLAYLAQNQQVHWPLPARDVVALGRLPHGDAHTAATQSLIDTAMNAAGARMLAARNVLTLSGGERARVLLARALAVNAPILLADEPLAALDPAHQLQCMQLLHAQAVQGRAVAVVLHDLTLASRYCHRLLLLNQGHVVACGEPAQVLSDSHLAEVFGIQALRLPTEDGGCIVPWHITPQRQE